MCGLTLMKGADPLRPAQHRTRNWTCGDAAGLGEVGAVDMSAGGCDLARKAFQRSGVETENWAKTPSCWCGHWVGLGLLCWVEGLGIHYSSKGPGVFEETQDKKGAFPGPAKPCNSLCGKLGPCEKVMPTSAFGQKVSVVIWPQIVFLKLSASFWIRLNLGIREIINYLIFLVNRFKAKAFYIIQNESRLCSIFLKKSSHSLQNHLE